MSIIAAALRELMAAGLSGEALVQAVARIEEAQAPVRSKGAIRTEKWRHKASQSVTSDGGDASDGAAVPLETKGPETQKTQTPPPIPKENPLRGQKKKGTPLPEGWEPSEADCAYGRKLGLDNAQIADAAEEMRCWAAANENRDVTRKANWDRAFQGWLRRYRKQNKIAPKGGAGHAVPAVWVRDDTPAWRAWREARMREGKPPPFPTYREGGGGQWFPSEFPVTNMQAAE